MSDLLEAYEDALDIAAYRAAKDANEEAFPIELFDKIDAGESPLKVFREHRGLTQTNLAKKAGTSQGMINHIEKGNREGTVSMLKDLANALDIDLDMLIDA